MSTSETQFRTTAQEKNPEVDQAADGLVIAPLPARVLAAVIDYLVLSALLFGSTHLFPYSDWQFVIPLFCGALYLGIGNSEVTAGQTLGKKAFGLRVISLDASENTLKYLSIPRSTCRYLFSFGILILLAELPPLFYRFSAAELGALVSELHMLCAMAYFITLVAVAIAYPLHRSFHDLLCSSLVVRGTPHPNQKLLLPSRSAQIPLLRKTLPVFFSLLLAFGLWRIAGLHSPRVTAITELRYAIEARFPFRLLSVTETENGLEIQGLVLSNEKEKASKIVLEVGDYLASRLPQQALQSGDSETKRLVFSVFSPDDPLMSQQKIDYPLTE